jgi:hypothetical protein
MVIGFIPLRKFTHEMYIIACMMTMAQSRGVHNQIAPHRTHHI